MEELLKIKQSFLKTQQEFVLSLNSEDRSQRLPVLGLPLMSDDGDSCEISSRTAIFPIENLKRPKYLRSFTPSISHSPSFICETQTRYSNIISTDVEISNVLLKTRKGGVNIVNKIKKFPANSYLARKERYIKRMNQFLSMNNDNKLMT